MTGKQQRPLGAGDGRVEARDRRETRGLRYDVEATAAAGGVRRETRGAGQKVSARVCVIDMFDADDETIKERWVFERVEITPNGDRTYVNNDIAAFPFAAEVIGEY